MDTFRILSTTLSCLRCGADRRVDVQFKTGDDGAMPEYQVGDVVADVDPDVYEGITDAYCAPCMSRWIVDEKRVWFELMSEEISAGHLVARRATYRHGALDGHPEIGLVETILDPTPMNASDVRSLAELPEGFGWPTITARLADAKVALWHGDMRLEPHDPSFGDESARWWMHQGQEVSARLRRRGWPLGGDQWMDVAVLVDAEHRVRLAP
jgi:hypothetical protein